MNNPTSVRPNQPVLAEKLSFWTKVAYGAGDLGPAITANILAVYLLIFFTNVAGLSPGIAGSALMVGKIWDAVNDPIVGALSDRTQSRWGRRLSWMILGAVPFGLFFFLQWYIPPFGQWGLFWYYVLVSICFNNFYTAVNLPYTALTPELTQDYDERTSLNSFRFTFSISGSILSLGLALLIFNWVKQPVQQYLVLGGITALLSVLPIYWCVIGVWKRVQQTERLRQVNTTNEAPIPYLEQLKIAFSNQPFLYVIGIYLCSWLAVQNTVAIIPYFVKNWMGLTNQDFTKVVIAVQLTALLMLFVWNGACRRVGKKAVYFMGMSLWIMAEIGLFFLQPGQISQMYILAVMAGCGVSTAYLIPWSMIPDVIELDELQTGQRREGIFYGFMVLLQKVGLAFGLFLVGQALQISGFIASIPGQPEPTQPTSALNAIRWLIGPVPTMVLIIGLILAYFYPITREVHAEILLKLNERHKAAREAD